MLRFESLEKKIVLLESISKNDLLFSLLSVNLRYSMTPLLKAWIFIAFFGATFLISSPLFAGVILTKNRQAEMGVLVESSKAIALQSQYGAVDFKKDYLLWYSTEVAMDTLLKAARKARTDGNTQAAMILFDLSLSKEPDTKLEAQNEMDALEKELIRRLTSSDSTPHDFRNPEEKIARAREMIDHANVFLNKTTYLNSQFEEEAKKTGKKILEAGNQLLAEGQQELAVQKAKQAAANAEEQKIREGLKRVKRSIEASIHITQWSDEEKIANAILVGLFGLVISSALWRMTHVKEK